MKLSEETEAVPVDWKEAFLLTEGLGLSLPASLELVVCAEPLLSTLHEDMSRLRGLKKNYFNRAVTDDAQVKVFYQKHIAMEMELSHNFNSSPYLEVFMRTRRSSVLTL